VKLVLETELFEVKDLFEKKEPFAEKGLSVEKMQDKETQLAAEAELLELTPAVNRPRPSP
jgi:hypothetical protein